MSNHSVLQNGFAGTTTSSSAVGFLCWYSIGTKTISREVLLASMFECGVDALHMPNVIRVPDAFRRATKAIERKTNTKQGSISFLIKEVSSDRGRIQRNIVREVIDSKNEALQYSTEEAILTLDKNENTVNVNVLNDEVRHLADEAVNLFERYKNLHDDNALRSMCTSILRSMSPILVKNTGGIYFVPCKYEAQLRAFVQLINLLPQSDAELLPVMRSSDSMGFVRKAATRQLTNNLARLKEVYDDEESTASDITGVLESADLSVRVYRDYRDLIEEVQDFDQSLPLFERMLEDVASRKKDRKPKSYQLQNLKSIIQTF